MCIPRERYSADDPAYNRTYWEAQIREQGPERAYAEFLERTKGISANDMHLSLHVMGEALFTVAGFDAISTCSMDPKFACYHGFFSRAAATMGASAVVPELQAWCGRSETYVACIHGLGHGLLDFFGPQRITEALESCTGLDTSEYIDICMTGVFMEYNTPFISTEDGSYELSVRPFGGDGDLYTLCTSLPDTFKDSCYGSLPQWWTMIDRSFVNRIDALCASVPTPYQTSCTRGGAHLVCAAVIGCEATISNNPCPQDVVGFLDTNPLAVQEAERFCPVNFEALRRR